MSLIHYMSKGSEKMNLQRNLVLQEVKGLFGYKSIQIQEKYNVNAKEVVQSFGQIIVNLHFENKIFLNDFQKDVEQLLEQISKSQNLMEKWNFSLKEV
jgi:hypothetical protein